MNQRYKNSTHTPKSEGPANMIITCRKNDYSARRGLGAHVVDVTPGRGDILFRTDRECYDEYRNAVTQKALDAAAAYLNTLHVFLLEQALRNPISWLLPLRNPHIAFVDNHREKSKPDGLLYPREIVAKFYIKHMTEQGYSLEHRAAY